MQLIINYRNLELGISYILLTKLFVVQDYSLIPFYGSGEYDAVIICLGAKANMLPEIFGRLPLRTCRGVIAHLELPDDMG